MKKTTGKPGDDQLTPLGLIHSFPKQNNGLNLNQNINVFHVDDHPLLQEALAGVITSMDGFTLSGSASTVEEAIVEIESSQPDMLVVDFTIGGNDGFEFIHHLKKKYPKRPLLVFSVAEENRIGPRAFREGADGVLTKGAPIKTIREAIKTVSRGEKWASPTLTQLLIGSGNRQNLQDKLTRRELQVLQQVGKGNSNQEIAEELGISAKTVGNHRENIKRKLGVKNARELMTIARDYFVEITEGCSANES